MQLVKKPTGYHALEFHDGVLVWPPEPHELPEFQRLPNSEALQRMIQLVSAAYASFVESTPKKPRNEQDWDTAKTT